MANANPINTIDDLLPDLPGYDPEPADGVRVGESPIPGITLKRILRGHTGGIKRISWSPDGRLLASPSADHTVRVWNVAFGECTAVFEGHNADVLCVAWSPDGHKLASASHDKTIRIWDTATQQTIVTLQGHEDFVNCVAWSPDGHKLASGSRDRTIRIWDLGSWKEKKKLDREFRLDGIVFSPDGEKLATSSYEIEIWDANGTKLLHSLKGHSSDVYSANWSPNGKLIASGSFDNTVRIWSTETGRLLKILEAHTESVKSTSFSSDNNLLVSKSTDSTVRIWRCDTWDEIGVFREQSTTKIGASISFHPYLPNLASLGEKDTVIRIWDLDIAILRAYSSTESIHYTTAKLVLVGDSGVGKTGLGWKLTHGEFKEHASTHGQQFWVVNDLSKKRTDGTECEAILWDLAGQPIYRTTHALFLDDVDLSLLLFDPTNRQDPLQGVEFWLKQLRGKSDLPPSALVGARVDRGEATLTREELAQFCQRHGISGGYVSTSAMTGQGLDELMAIIKAQIPWDKMTTTVTTITFKRVKDYVLSLKEQPGRPNVLVSPAELRQQLQATDPEWEFSDAEMMTAVGHLQTHGYVTILRASSGQQSILLAPDLLVSLVASIVLQASKHPQALGSLSETALLRGDYPFEELTGLDKAEREILLDAAVLRFLQHNICFRETLGLETLLIFPALIRLKRPLYDDIETTDDISYIIRGAVENIYAALVVLLGYTPTFTRVNQWQNQAQYETSVGHICGFRQIEERAGEIELILYYANTTPAAVRTMFRGLFEVFLNQRNVEAIPYPPLYCLNSHLQERTTVIKWLRQGKDFLFCPECGEKVALTSAEEPLALGQRDRKSLARDENLAQLRRKYEIHLSNVKSFRRDRTAPRCFISYLPEQAAWVKDLTTDLRDAGVHVLEKTADIALDDFILLAATPAYKNAWQNLSLTIADAIELIRPRLQQKGRTAVIPLLVEGNSDTCLPSNFRGIHSGEFQDETRYTLALYDLVLTLYAIPFNHLAFKSLREDLERQWQQTLSHWESPAA